MCAQTQKWCNSVLYYTVTMWNTVNTASLVQVQDVQTQVKSSGDVAGIAKHQLLYCNTILFNVLYYNIKHVFFTFVFFLCIIYVKSIISLLQYSTV